MNVVRRTCGISLIGLLILVGATSCVYTIFIKATGSINQPITFKFFHSANDEKPSKFDILDVIVQEQSVNADWVTIWDLNGKASLSEIVYGSKYQGLNEIVPPKPFRRNGKYRLYVSGTTWPAPGIGKAGMEFTFDEEGKVIESRTEVLSREEKK